MVRGGLAGIISRGGADNCAKVGLLTNFILELVQRPEGPGRPQLIKWSKACHLDFCNGQIHDKCANKGEPVENFTAIQDEVYDIFTEVATFMEWVNAMASNMGGLQTCKNYIKIASNIL